MLARNLERQIAPARHPERFWSETRLLAVDRASGAVDDLPVAGLVDLLDAGDLLVLNDASTLPASLLGRVNGESVELRLATTQRFEPFPDEWMVVLFGEGDWRTDTDRRRPPPRVKVGDVVQLRTLSATVLALHAVSPRLLTVRFDRSAEQLGQAMFAVGRPVQYAHLARDVGLDEVQTPYAARPWAIEMPSTGRPLRWPLLERLVAGGVKLAWLTEAAGLSATGDPALDRALPLPERYEIPEATAEAIAETKRAGGRVIAAGTTVVRALEANGGRAGQGIATLRLGPQTTPEVVDGLLTGIHSPGESHWELLRSFASESVLLRSHAEAIRLGYLGHEHGDLMLVTT